MVYIVDIAPCERCGIMVRTGKPDIDYLIVPGFGYTRDYIWHRKPTDCALAEHLDPKSVWFHNLIQ